MPEQKAPYL